MLIHHSDEKNALIYSNTYSIDFSVLKLKSCKNLEIWNFVGLRYSIFSNEDYDLLFTGKNPNKSMLSLICLSRETILAKLP